MLEGGKKLGAKAEWPDAAAEDGPGDNMKLTGFMVGAGKGEEEGDELGTWFGRKVTEEVF